MCVIVTLSHLTLQRPDAHILLVKLLLLESDPLHQIINAPVLGLQHQLTEKQHNGIIFLAFYQLYSAACLCVKCIHGAVELLNKHQV